MNYDIFLFMETLKLKYSCPPKYIDFPWTKKYHGSKVKDRQSYVILQLFCSSSVYGASLDFCLFLPQNSRFVRNQWYYTIEQNRNTMYLAFVHPFETFWVLKGSFGTQHQRFCQNICQYFPYFWFSAPFNRPLY